MKYKNLGWLSLLTGAIFSLGTVCVADLYTQATLLSQRQVERKYVH